MDKQKILPGDELVRKGVTKLDAQLPDVGLKDVLPNGSWLEQKQIQLALEAKKCLIEVERIEKRGVLSQAEWREDLNLAEVTQHVGGHWQYMGHNVGKTLYVTPEEALFLMEVNCLQLKHNGVTVSLQQAYELLLRSNTTLTHYKVYSYLSRIGYKVVRYERPKETDVKVTNKDDITELNSEAVKENTNIPNNKSNDTKSSDNTENETVTIDVNTAQNHSENSANNLPSNVVEETVSLEKDSENNRANENIVKQDGEDKVGDDEEKMEVTEVSQAVSNETHTTAMEIDNTKQDHQKSKIIKLACSKMLSNLENRKLKPLDSSILEKHFELVPDLFQKHKVTVKTPNEYFIPKNIFLNKLCYDLDVVKIKTMKNTPETDNKCYSLSEEVNGEHIRRIRDNSVNTPYYDNNWIPQMPRFPNLQFRPFFQFRPRLYTNFASFNVFQNLNFQRFQFSNMSRAPTYDETPDFISINSSNLNQHNSRRRRMPDKKKQIHLQAIKSLADRVKSLARVGWNSKNIDALKSLIGTFNIRYKMNIRLTDTYDIVNEENIVDTIDLDCDDEPANKKAKVRNNYDENLDRLKKMALKLKQLEASNNSTSRCRRAFSKLIKNFNKHYSADIYMDNSYSVFDKNHITLDCSSESDCVIEENVEPTPKGKLVKNPFNILKRLSQNQDSSFQIPSTSNAMNMDNTPIVDDNYKKVLNKIFDKNWLPDDNDFGRPEIPTKTTNETVIEAKKMEYLFEFIKTYPNNFENWLDVKITFIRNLSQSMLDYEDDITNCEEECDVKPIIGSGNISNMSEVLKKLSIIPFDDEVISETSLAIKYDVYNRDVANFRKTCRPIPNFRIICLEESSPVPSGAEVAAIHTQYKDDVPLVFAIAGIGSVSFLRINPTPLPLYIPNSDMEF